MKKLIQKFKQATLFWLCLFVLIDARTLSEFVFCIGQDGHFALETAAENSLDSDIPSCESDLKMESAEIPSHCGKCFDVAISALLPDPGLPGQSSAEKTVSHVLALVHSNVAPLPSPLDIGGIPRDLNPTLRLQSSVRSVVLRV